MNRLTLIFILFILVSNLALIAAKGGGGGGAGGGRVGVGRSGGKGGGSCSGNCEIIVASVFGAIFAIGIILFLFNLCGLRAYLCCNRDAPQSELVQAKKFQLTNPPRVTDIPMEKEYGYPVWAISPFAQSNPGAVIEGNTVKFLTTPGLEDRSVQTVTRVSNYYEIKIMEKKLGVCIGMGLASQPYPPFRLPGWESNSIAYHSDTGNKFFNDCGRGDGYRTGYGQGDIIGCGYLKNEKTWTFYFTMNGKRLPNAYTTSVLSNETYATIGADGECTIKTNFGEDPFAYQVENPPVYNLNQQPPIMNQLDINQSNQQQLNQVEPTQQPPQYSAEGETNV